MDQFYNAVIRLKDADGMANSVDHIRMFGP